MRNIKTNHRVERAAREFLERETGSARNSFNRVLEGGAFDDHIWRQADPIGAKLAIELRRALEALDR